VDLKHRQISRIGVTYQQILTSRIDGDGTRPPAKTRLMIGSLDQTARRIEAKDRHAVAPSVGHIECVNIRVELDFRWVVSIAVTGRRRRVAIAYASRQTILALEHIQ